MNKKLAAMVTAGVSLAIGLGVSLGAASATEEPGGSCNNYGNGAVVVAPFCGANFGPSAPSLPTYLPPSITRPPFTDVLTPGGPLSPSGR